MTEPLNLPWAHVSAHTNAQGQLQLLFPRRGSQPVIINLQLDEADYALFLAEMKLYQKTYHAPTEPKPVPFGLGRGNLGPKPSLDDIELEF